VSQSGTLRRKHQSLTEIKEIMESLKTMALIETRKLTPVIARQSALLDNIQIASWNLRAHHPRLLLKSSTSETSGLIAIGSERGFCGDLNGVIDDVASAHTGPLLLIGTRLAERVEESVEGSRLAGLSVTEDIDPSVEHILTEMADHEPMSWRVVYQDSSGVRDLPLEPPEPPDWYREPAYAMDLYLSPQALWERLSQQHLVEALHLHTLNAFLFENQRRLQHLESAVQHLETKLELLKKKQNRNRQEAITQELEVLLLNAERNKNSLRL